MKTRPLISTPATRRSFSPRFGVYSAALAPVSTDGTTQNALTPRQAPYSRFSNRAAARRRAAGCGRKGPLELPPDVQAARQEKVAEQQAAEAAKNPEEKQKLSQQGVKPKAERVEGDVGHRPPEDYPFFLDPIL